MKSLFLPVVLGLTLSLFAAPSLRATELDKSMKLIGGACKELMDDLKQPKESDKDKYLALTTTIKEQAKISRERTPKLAQTLPADQRDAMVQGYQKDMDKFIADIDSLSAALKDAKWDDARALMNTLGQDMTAGHKQYRAHKGGKDHDHAPAATDAQPAPAAQ